MRTLLLSDRTAKALVRVLDEWEATDRSETWAVAGAEDAALLVEEDAVSHLVLGALQSREQRTQITDADVSALTVASLTEWRAMQEDGTDEAEGD